MSERDPPYLGCDLDLLPPSQPESSLPYTVARLPRATSIVYTPELGEQITTAYANGMSLSAIARLPGMPTFKTILKWCKDDSKFAREFENARLARALFYEDHVSEIALAPPCDKDEAPGTSIKLSALITCAGWSDPTRYGKKVTVGGDKGAPIVFKVVTGVPENSHHRSVVLNADGTQVMGSGSSEEEHHEEHSLVEDVGSNPTLIAPQSETVLSNPDDPEFEAHD